MIEKDLKELENNFLNHLGEYYGVKTYENKATRLKVFKRHFDKAVENKLFTEHQEKILTALLHNFEIQLLNIFKQTDNFVEFLDVLIKLSKKPDDKESLEKIVEYAKSLGI
tara:strand:- start:117 stop:449 length:333 start_codon:yes stop_codon:yes gene_type:complete